MGALHISDADLARDHYAVLAKVEQGVEVIVERDHRPVATIKPSKRSGRPISECIASARAGGSKVILDPDFGKNVEEGIRERSQEAVKESPASGRGRRHRLPHLCTSEDAGLLSEDAGVVVVAQAVPPA